MLNVILLVTGQYLFKIGLTQAGGFTVANVTKVLINPLIVAGLVLYIIATGLWFAVLSKTELSFAYPLQSTAYVLAVLVDRLVFKQMIPLSSWVGVGIIIIGVYLVSMR